MTLNWLGFVYGVCLILVGQGIEQDEFVYPGCGLYDTSHPRIIGGDVAPLGSAPFMAYLMKNNAFVCGGSIVNRRFILTAAHCVSQNMSVRLGEHDKTSNPDCVAKVCMPPHQDFGVAAIGFHKEWREWINDIALIKLNRDIVFNMNVQPICLLLSPTQAPRVSEYEIFGWGKTSLNGPVADVLQTANLSHFPQSQCEKQFFRDLDVNQICAGSLTGTDACFADSGSPLVTKINHNRYSRYLQLGVVSYGDDSCLGTGVYTYTPGYGNWIRNTMQSLGSH